MSQTVDVFRKVSERFYLENCKKQAVEIPRYSIYRHYTRKCMGNKFPKVILVDCRAVPVPGTQHCAHLAKAHVLPTSAFIPNSDYSCFSCSTSRIGALSAIVTYCRPPISETRVRTQAKPRQIFREGTDNGSRIASSY